MMWIRDVEAGRAYYGVLGFGLYLIMAFVKKPQSLKPASSILSEKNDHILWY